MFTMKKEEKRLYETSPDFLKTKTAKGKEKSGIELFQTQTEFQNFVSKINIKKYSEPINYSPVAYVTINRKGEIAELNILGASILGNDRLFFINHEFQQFISHRSKNDFCEFLSKVFSVNCVTSCELSVPKIGEPPVIIFVTGSVAVDDEHCLLWITDITKQKIIEEDLKILYRRNSALERSRKALKEACDEYLFLREACKILIQNFEYELAWIGFTEEGKNEMIRHIASEGRDDENSEFLNIIRFESDKEPGLIEAAIKTMKPAFCKDILSDINFGPCRKEALKKGFASSIVLPMNIDNNLLGVIVLYSREKDSFSENEINLLSEIASDVEFGIKNIRSRTKFLGTEKILKEYRKDLNRAQAVSKTGILRLDINLNELKWSEETYRIFNILEGTPLTFDIVLTFVHPDDRDFVEKSWNAFLRGEPYEIEHRIIAGDKVKWVHSTAELEFNKGVLVGGFGTIQEITDRVRAEEDLRESEEKYRMLFDGMIEGFAYFKIILDSNGKRKDALFMSINPSFERQIGLKAKDVVGKNVSQVFPDIDSYWLEVYGKIALSGNNIEFEIYYSKIDKFFKVSAFCPRLGYFALIFEDITWRKKAEQELSRTKNYLEHLINFANAPIIVWGPNYEIQLFNKASENLTGYKSREVVGKNPNIIFPVTNVLSSSDKINLTVSNNFQDSVEIPILCKNKETRTVLWNFANIYDSENTLISIIAQGNDITERIKAEEQLKKYASDLKDLNATKDKFFRIIAHDLKNPFSGLLGASELLIIHANNQDKERIVKYAQIIYNSAKSGFMILENLLEWSRSQTGYLNFNPEELDISKLVEENFLNLNAIAVNKQIKLSSGIPCNTKIFADRNMINTVLRNLLINAVKFTPTGGKVTVQALKDHQYCTISVKDTGVGISEEDIAKLFRIDIKYTNPGTSEERGTGLGLILCKEFVEKHGGKIWVKSEVKKGSEFKFSIPVR